MREERQVAKQGRDVFLVDLASVLDNVIVATHSAEHPFRGPMSQTYLLAILATVPKAPNTRKATLIGIPANPVHPRPMMSLFSPNNASTCSAAVVPKPLGTRDTRGFHQN